MCVSIPLFHVHDCEHLRSNTHSNKLILLYRYRKSFSRVEIILYSCMKASLYLAIYHNHRLVYIVALFCCIISHYRKVMRLKL